MKIDIYSDLVVEPFLKNAFPNADTHLFYDESWIIEDKILDRKPDILILHFDIYFKKNLVWYLEVFQNLLKSLVHTKIKVLIPSQINPYSNTLYHDMEESFLSQLNPKKYPNLYIYDFYSWVSKIGIDNFYHFKLGLTYQMPYTKIAQAILKTKLSNFIENLQRPDKKVIVLDCDNTLWGGIVGEDGVDKIHVGKSSQGLIFTQFQEFLATRKKIGFLLCIASKNNFNDVKSVFDKRNMPLKWDDFIIKKINWDDKTQNIKTIANELNLGIDSFIFIDDSHLEVSLVKHNLPTVECILFKNDYDEFQTLLSNSVFTKKNITKDDLKKTEQYISENKRNLLNADTTKSKDQIIKELQLKLDVKENDCANLERLSQLTEKTNQFNLNKRVYTKVELMQFVEQGNKIFSASLSDKFGEYGIIGLILVNIQNNTAQIENYLLSCRALGRGVEKQFWEHTIDILKLCGLELTKVKFTKTEKNKPAEDFYKTIKI